MSSQTPSSNPPSSQAPSCGGPEAQSGSGSPSKSGETSDTKLQDSSAAGSLQEGSSDMASPSSGRLRRFSLTAGPAQFLAQKVMDLDGEVQEKYQYDSCDKDDIIQALSNASREYKRQTDDRKAEHYGVREVAEKWDDIGDATSDQFNNCGKSQLISHLRHCLQDVRCIKQEATDLISNGRVTL